MISRIAQHAYGELGLTPERVAQEAQVTPQLRTIQKTMRRGFSTGKPCGPGNDLLTAWPNYLNASDDIDARKVREMYYRLPKYLARHLPIEAFCVAAGVSPIRILEILTSVIVRQGAQASHIIAAVNHPRVVTKTIEMALTDDGVKDREVLHKHAGFLPTPRGPSTSIVVQQTATANAAAVTVPVPPPEQTIRRLADRFNLARALPEQVSTPMPAMPAAELVEAEIDDDVREE